MAENERTLERAIELVEAVLPVNDESGTGLPTWAVRLLYRAAKSEHEWLRKARAPVGHLGLGEHVR